MAKKPDFREIQTLNPSLTVQTYRYLQRLKRSGLYGSTESEVARILIQDQLKLLTDKGVLPLQFDEAEDVKEQTGGESSGGIA